MGEGINVIGRISRTRGSERLQKTKADLNSRAFKSAVTRAARMTDENYVTLASATMARAFGYKDIEKKYRQIEKEHFKAGNLTLSLQERRRSLDATTEKRIKKDYGDAGMKAWKKAR